MFDKPTAADFTALDEDISKVFDRFYTTRSDQSEQGLGLAITKSIINEMN